MGDHHVTIPPISTDARSLLNLLQPRVQSLRSLLQGRAASRLLSSPVCSCVFGTLTRIGDRQWVIWRWVAAALIIMWVVVPDETTMKCPRAHRKDRPPLFRN